MTAYILTTSKSAGNPLIARQLRAKYKTAKNQINHLSFPTAQKMIKRLLTCDRVVTKEIKAENFTIKELAEELSVDLPNLEAFIKAPSKTLYGKMASKISLPLIRLYYDTKWTENE